MDSQDMLFEVKNKFSQMFGHQPAGVVAAPGRVNLIGEHTDYNDGFVLPIAIGLRTLAAWSPREDGRVCFASLQKPGEEVEIDLCEEISAGNPSWANYPKGVTAGLLAVKIPLVGCNILFNSDVPVGSGLSSSASLEIATGLALLTAANMTLDQYQLALICQKAEHEYAGTPCGIMDQAISVLGQHNHALLLDCRNGQTTQVPFNDPNVQLLVCDTKVKHELSDGGYAARRDQCYEAAEILGVEMLRDANDEMLQGAKEKLNDKQFMRARHVIGEIARTTAAVEALNENDLNQFGQLMYQSHNSLRDDYEVSCDELDFIVDCASKQQGVLGARMTGGGFGGCAIVLVKNVNASAVTKEIETQFKAKFDHDCAIFATQADQGASVWE